MNKKTGLTRILQFLLLTLTFLVGSVDSALLAGFYAALLFAGASLWGSLNYNVVIRSRLVGEIWQILTWPDTGWLILEMIVVKLAFDVFAGTTFDLVWYLRILLFGLSALLGRAYFYSKLEAH